MKSAAKPICTASQNEQENTVPGKPPIDDDDANLDDIQHYELPGGWVVLAGRTDAANDRLSIKLARPNDWWFHVRGMSGSHVLLRAREGEEPERDTLKLAAAIAAWHSKARSGGVTPVSCTRARFVTKARGHKRGTVHIRKETVIKVRPGLPVLENSGQAD
jgi:predicted ribosome quality control (RQC) complex YloA/Tae2 family protein